MIDHDAVGRRLWPAAALWMLFLGPLFFLVYGFCNEYASRLPEVPSFYYSWERRIPFVPALILPYFSIDLFYAASVFLCRNRRELHTHAYRIVAAIFISAVGFLAFPLKFAFDHPAVGGVYGFFFGLLDGLDKPFNQAPSLHVSLLIILSVRYADHLAGLWRCLMAGWFALIGLSILFVYQHHVIDFWTGLVAGTICLYAFPDAPRHWQGFTLTVDPQRRRLGAYYFSTSALLSALAVTLQSWAWVLLWPALSLLLVAIAYFLAGPAVFQKLSGRLSWPAAILLAPYLFGAWISYRCLTRTSPAMHRVTPNIYFGRFPRAGDLNQFATVAVLDLTAEFCAAPVTNRRDYRNIPILDLTAPEPVALRAAIEFIDRQIESGPVYVHCALGLSRSAAVVAAWLVRSKQMVDAEAALRHLAALRPGVTWSQPHVAAITAAAGTNTLSLADDK